MLPSTFSFSSLRLESSEKVATYSRTKKFDGFHITLKPLRYSKRRQGRSTQTRRYKAEERKHLNSSSSSSSSSLNRFKCLCPNRKPGYLIEDLSSGDTICQDCGSVVGRLGEISCSIPLNKFSKPYSREVHYQQRIAQLTAKDPILPQYYLLLIEDYIRENKETDLFLKPLRPQIYGIDTFRHIIGQLNKNGAQLDKRIARHWIQIRKRLNNGPGSHFTNDLLEGERPENPVRGKNEFERLKEEEEYYEDSNNLYYYETMKLHAQTPGQELPTIPWNVEISCDILDRMKQRYMFVSKCFDDGPQDVLRPNNRHNMFTLNYVILQLLRIESEELFEEYAKFLPQLLSVDQPHLNNERWKCIVEWCDKHGRYYHNQLTDTEYWFDWPYKPLKFEDILNYVSFFI